jgi:glycosyltransferase involved in cell wall biosynthesis
MPVSLRKHQGAFRLLCIAKHYAHKNLEIIIETLARFRQELKDVVVIMNFGSDDHATTPKLIEKIRSEGLTNRIVRTGWIQTKELEAYYRHSHALIFPTLLETFSSTYLEAMHFGLPILTSDMDFAREVCGDAAIYFDPRNPLLVKNAIARIRGDDDLRKSLVEKGKARVEKYYVSWDSVVKKLVVDLESIAGTDRGPAQ